ncbi:MAG: hypothetical protein DRQ24_08665 [Candidatus Latescibacterota bacterium]|nr:MAG: hypothetical protein DRQ24_08665 [Candidatus Latescibacterota bacterium]
MKYASLSFLLSLVACLCPGSALGAHGAELGEVVEERARGPIKVGMGSANIAPPWPIKPSHGYQAPTNSFYNREIYVKVLILQVEDLRRALVVFDAVGLRLEASEHIQREIAAQTDLEEEEIIIAATHNHSYPGVVGRVRDLLATQGVRAVQEALAGMFEAQIGFGMKQLPEYMAINRGRAADGKVCTRLYVMRIDDLDGNVRGVFFNFPPHPTYFHIWWGGKRLAKHGPGWPGYVRQWVEMKHNLKAMFEMFEKGQQEFRPLFTIFTLGTGGNLWPCDDFIAGIDGVDRKGWVVTVGQAVLELVEEIETRKDVTMIFRSKVIELPFGKTHPWRFGEPPDITPEHPSWREPRTCVQALILNDMAIGIVPAEMSVELGDKFREKAGYKYNILVTIAGGSVGYICPEVEEIEKVTYESKSSIFDPGRGRIITDAVISLINPDHVPTRPVDPKRDMGVISGRIAYDGEHRIIVGIAGSEWHVQDYHPRFWGRRTEPDSEGHFTFEPVAPWKRFLYVMEVADDYVPYEPGKILRLLTYSRPVQVEPGETTYVELEVTGHFKEHIKALRIDQNRLKTGADWIRGVLDIEGELREGECIQGGIYRLGQLLGIGVRRAYALSTPLTSVEVDSSRIFTFEALKPGEYLLYFWFDVNGNGIVEPRIDVNSGFSQPILLGGE